MLFAKTIFKTKLKIITFFIMILVSRVSYANEPDQDDANLPFTLLTIPKSGSHLIIKALHLLTGGGPIWHTKFPSLYTIPVNEGFLYTHLCISPLLERDYSQ